MKKIRVIICIFTAMVLFAISIGLATSGDMFLSFLGRKLHIDISYGTHTGFISCFILRSITLENPKLRLKDADTSITCRTAHFTPRFDELWNKQTIVLECVLNDVSFPGIAEQFKDTKELASLIQGDIQALAEVISSVINYDYIYVTLALHGDRVTFRSFEAKSDKLILTASGFITENSSFGIKLKIFFSPEFTKDFPVELKEFLTKEGEGWLSYSLNAESGKDNPFFVLESDRIKINFKKVEVHK
ncbi:MAG: hypothetical protein ABIH57_01345 [Candidatus Omnitrophota bacterium]